MSDASGLPADERTKRGAGEVHSIGLEVRIEASSFTFSVGLKFALK